MNYMFKKPVPLSQAAEAMGYKNALSGSGPVKQMTAQEKFDAAKNIYANKIGYMSQHNSGNYGEAEKFHDAAAPYYSSLYQGGAGEVADTLHSSDVATAGKVVSDLGFDAYAENYRNNANKVIDNNLKGLTLDFDRQKTSTNEQYDTLARQGYINYMEAKKSLPQQLKAQGMTGGLSESSQIALHNNYGQQATENQRARLAALADLDLAKTKATLEAENQRLGIENTLSDRAYEKLLTDYGYDREDARLDKQIKSQFDLQKDSQNWQSEERKDTQNWQSLEQRNAEAHELKMLAIENNHDANQADLDRQVEIAISNAQRGDFNLISQLTGIPKEELLQNYKNLLWLDAAYPQMAESYIHHVSGSDPGGNAPDVDGYY